ncbi:uncharacterized protein LOC134232355 [Saccostrea cucullata]|uniref:uncharacterized protein LOC134232355 n=1 Tax=Saccostrea cuccullata TaxID=36930 RepID=UPI002ED67FC0
MEPQPAMACEMLEKIENVGGKVDTVIMDNDSTTMARVKDNVDPNMSKRSDSNHTKKGFTGALVELSSNNKVLSCNITLSMSCAGITEVKAVLNCLYLSACLKRRMFNGLAIFVHVRTSFNYR